MVIETNKEKQMTKFITDSDANILSDFFKEVNGFRPRWINWSEMTVEEGRKMYNSLMEESQQYETVSDREFFVINYLDRYLSYGAKDEDEAYKWYKQGA
jgi:hypothetical protein